MEFVVAFDKASHVAGFLGIFHPVQNFLEISQKGCVPIPDRLGNGGRFDLQSYLAQVQ